ncbi:MAG: hypothetical protein AAGF79_10415 [Pseudomonadota bacterium]
MAALYALVHCGQEAELVMAAQTINVVTRAGIWQHRQSRNNRCSDQMKPGADQGGSEGGDGLGAVRAARAREFVLRQATTGLHPRKTTGPPDTPA